MSYGAMRQTSTGICLMPHVVIDALHVASMSGWTCALNWHTRKVYTPCWSPPCAIYIHAR